MNTPEIEILKKEVQFNLDGIEKSKVEDSSTKEDFAYFTEDVEEWKKMLNSEIIKQTCEEKNQEVVFDDEIIKNATGFALGPVALYEKKMYEMFSRTAKSLDEIKDYFKNKKYILYLIFHRTRECEVDMKNFTFKKLETPERYYIFRGCFLDEK